VKNKNHLAIIIPAQENNDHLQKTIKSIYNQTILPDQLIIILSTKDKITLSKKIDNKIVYSKVKNQVYQRTLGLKFLKKKIKILLQLDDKILLDKKSIQYLHDEWNKADDNIAGVAINPLGHVRSKINLFHHLTLTSSNEHSKILPSGFVCGWSETKKNKYMEWLNGGMTSWKLKLVPQIYNRKFPIVKWSVCEDLFFSYKVSKKYKLLLSAKSKAKIILKNKNITLLENFNNGYVFAKILHSFVSQNKKFSIFIFYYSIFSSSILGIIITILKFDFLKSVNLIGRMYGSLFKYSKNEIN
jgi:hypothetical protein